MADKESMDKECIRKLIKEAMKARENAYSPYSGFSVGAAILTRDTRGSYNKNVETECNGQDSHTRIFAGCNIENSSYGATMCAERAAVGNAVSHGYRKFVAIAIVGGESGAQVHERTYPCGICRQVLSEFNPDMYVIAAGSEDDYDIRRLSDFIPEYFRLDSIHK